MLRKMTTLGARVARSLEAGRGGFASALASRAWEATSRVSRRLTFESGSRVIAVGGSTLGGSGKTPLAMACAKQLASDGDAVALVGHAYGARPHHARIVAVDDEVVEVGDEALAAARALASSGVSVVVGPSRQAAIDHALRFARVVVLDGVGQTTPVRAHLALLALDANEPWGANACPPRGDLRAAKAALLSACDRVVRVGAGGAGVVTTRPVDIVTLHSDGASLGTQPLPWSFLRERRIGLWTALARPGRLEAALAREGVNPVLLLRHGDHAVPSPRDIAEAIARARRADVDLWVSTSKCVTHLPPHLGGIPVATLGYELSLPTTLVNALHHAVREAGSHAPARLTAPRGGL
jgi:tetraacyldisaccharide 4'-kinase